MAQATDIVKKSFTFAGESAGEVATLLGLDRNGTLELELADYLSAGNGDIKNKLIWDAEKKELLIEGVWYDWHKAKPKRKGPRFSFDGPAELDQKSLGIFKNWAKLYQRIQGQGKSVGHRSSEIRRGITFRMESDKIRQSGWFMRKLRGLFHTSEVIILEALFERNGKGLWLEVRVGPPLR